MKHPHRSEAWMVLDELERKFRASARSSNPVVNFVFRECAEKVAATKRTIENRRRKLEER
jgi:hypothetical protein